MDKSSIAKFENTEIPVNGNTSKLDVTGTPLEDDCEISAISDWSVMKKLVKTNPWTDDEEQYSSVDEDLATEIVNDINVGLGSKCHNGAMFAICDGANDDHQFLLYNEYATDWNWRGVGKFTVSMSVIKVCLHFIPLFSIQGLVTFKQIDLPILMKKHLNFLRNCNEANTNIETYFSIKSNQTIRCAWDTTSLTPSLKCTKNANIVVSQSIPVGDFNSSIEEYWRQLEILEGVKQDIEKYKKSQSNADLVYQRCVR